MRAWLFLAVLLPGAASAQASASGVHWRLAIDGLECRDGGLSLAARIHYAGPKGPVEAPVVRLVDGEARAYPPKSLVWKRGGSKALAQWLSAGGITPLQGEDVGEVALRFDAPDADLRLEFGDVPAFAVKRKAGCLKPGQLQLPRRRTVTGSPAKMKVYRNAYPCKEGGTVRTVEANHPPHLPRQVLLFGRGYLPAARHADLPMGRAPAQAYAYAGPDELDAIEAAARRAIGADFRAYAGGRHFAFNWGEHRTAGGNQVDSVALYDLRSCAAAK